MKSKLSNFLFFVCSLFLTNTLIIIASAQKKIEIVNPYESISVHNIIATGNLKTRTVIITMEFQNDYAQNSNIYFSLGGYSDLGIKDDKGKKYKIYTSEQLIGTYV